MTSVVADPARSRIAVGSWSRRVDALVVEDDRSEATLGLPRGFALRLEWRQASDHVSVCLWAHGREQGGAVVVEDGMPSWLTAVPVCGCGDQGCSNASFGFYATLHAGDLPALVDTLQALPQRDASQPMLKNLLLWEWPPLRT
jgi:hypothetical protein